MAKDILNHVLYMMLCFCVMGVGIFLLNRLISFSRRCSMFDAGDVVHHKPSGETWLLACADAKCVYPCGWPETIAKAEDCKLVKKASPQERDVMLRSWADKGFGLRESICRDQLACKG